MSTNPLGMADIDGSGFYTLPSQLCSDHRKAFFDRFSIIIGSGVLLSAHADTGNQCFKNSLPKGVNRVRIGLGEQKLELSPHAHDKLMIKAGTWLGNQSFLSAYGNLETYLSDMLIDALAAEGSVEPQREALQLLIASKWESKLAKIQNRLKIDLSGASMKKGFQNINMSFLGKAVKNPINYLDAVADIRHRVVHFSSKLDDSLKSKYPDLARHASIVIPLKLTQDLLYFMTPLTDNLDKSFCDRMDWPRSVREMRSAI